MVWGSVDLNEIGDGVEVVEIEEGGVGVEEIEGEVDVVMIFESE